MSVCVTHTRAVGQDVLLIRPLRSGVRGPPKSQG